MHLRLASSADLEVLLELMTEFYGESGYAVHRERTTAALATLLADGTLGGVWVIEVNGTAAGHVVLTYVHSMEHGGRVAIIDDLYVRPAWRGGGLAGDALAQLRDRARADGVRALQVETGYDNAAAVAVYRRAGFAPVERLHLTLPLAPPTHAEA
jgi:GNAT superfamily N-acetyltransferase